MATSAHPQVKLPVQHTNPREDRAEYFVSVYTSDVRFAGTDATITIDIVGDRARSGRKPLVDMSKDTFERGQVGGKSKAQLHQCTPVQYDSGSV